MTPKGKAAKNALQLSHRETGPTTQENSRGNIFAHSGKYAILGNGANLRYDPIVNPIASLNKNPYNIQNIGITGSKAMGENLYRRAQNLGMGHALKKSYNL